MTTRTNTAKLPSLEALAAGDQDLTRWLMKEALREVWRAR